MTDEPIDLDALLAFGVNLDSVIARLGLLNYFTSIRDIQAATVAIEEEVAVPPCAFVSTVAESAQSSKTTGEHRQLVAVSLSILFAEQAVRIADDQRDAMERTRRGIMFALGGWTPDGAASKLEYDRYLLRGTSETAGVIWGEVLFRTSYWFHPLRAVQP